MANVTSTTGWQYAQDAIPLNSSTSLTIDSGSNRKLVLIIAVEIEADPAPSSMAVGGQSATESFTHHQVVGTYSDHWIYGWVWNEAAIQAMSGTTVTYTHSFSSFGRFWVYGTVENTDQTAFGLGGAWLDTAYDSTAASLPLTTTSSSGDLIIAAAVSRNASQTMSSWDTLTELFFGDCDGCGGGFASGNGGDSTTTLAGTNSEDTTAVALVFANAAGTKYLKMLVHPSAIGQVITEGVVLAESTSSPLTIVGDKIGEFVGGSPQYTFADGSSLSPATDAGYAVLKVPVDDFGGSALTTSNTPFAVARNASYTTGLVACTVVEE